MYRRIGRYLASAFVVLSLAAAGATTAGATVNPTTGQPGAPNNTCGPDNLVTPGNSMNASGSPFNANGQAGLVYAGNPDTHSLVANSTAAVSQYDVACVQLSH